MNYNSLFFVKSVLVVVLHLATKTAGRGRAGQKLVAVAGLEGDKPIVPSKTWFLERKPRVIVNST